MIQKVKTALSEFYHSSVGAMICFFHHLLNDKKPIKEKTLLVVAHPDDDALFFHTVLKKEKPFVALMTMGTSLRRMSEFRRAMKYYGVNYTYFPLASRDEREDLLLKNVKLVLSRGNFERVYTHSQSGEYGHVMHKRVHKAVISAFQGEVYTPVTEEKNASLPLLPKETILEKTEVFKSIYKTQVFVLDMWQNWLCREKHEVKK